MLPTHSRYPIMLSVHLFVCPCTEPVVSFALEPTGSKFIVIHGEPPTRIMASFYNINDKGNKVTLLSKSALLQSIILHVQCGL